MKELADEIKAAKQRTDWKGKFGARVEHLRRFDDPTRRSDRLMNPVQPYSSESRRFGVRMATFEKQFERIEYAADQFVLTGLKFDVESNKFVDDEKTSSKQQLVWESSFAPGIGLCFLQVSPLVFLSS